MKRILLIPKIKIQNANALSSPYTIGFPAMTAWLGGVHALQRKLTAKHFNALKFTSVAVACHHIDLQTYKGQGDYVHSIIGTGNPLDKNGNRPSFIEEARCHLIVSLVIEYQGVDIDDSDEFIAAITRQLHSGLKLASGDILDFYMPELFKIGDEKEQQQLMRKLMPGHVLIERRDLMIEAMEDGQDALDAMLDYLKIMYLSEQDQAGNIEWSSHKKTIGWIVPIATGFHGISDMGTAENQRDPETPHRFAESIVTLGEFKMPYRIKKLDDMLWHYHADLEKSLYLCQQNNQSY
ncbi:MAG: type I-F CRISPR-associated protein Csy2 [Methylococcaceae bacterium]